MQEKVNHCDAENLFAYPRAFAEVITYINEQNMLNSANNPWVFKLSELLTLYSQRLRQLGVCIPIVNKTQEVNASMRVTWASHYSHLAKDIHFEVGVSSLLPLLRDQAHDVATIKHALDKIKKHLHS